jgi:hypothetical protein
MPLFWLRFNFRTSLIGIAYVLTKNCVLNFSVCDYVSMTTSVLTFSIIKICSERQLSNSICLQRYKTGYSAWKYRCIWVRLCVMCSSSLNIFYVLTNVTFRCSHHLKYRDVTYFTALTENKQNVIINVRRFLVFTQTPCSIQERSLTLWRWKFPKRTLRPTAVK